MLRGLLDEPDHAIALEHRDPEPLRLGDAREEDLRIGPVLSKFRTNPARPSNSTLSPRYIRNGSPWTNSSAVSTAWARPSGASCGM